MNAKIPAFIICVKAFIHLLLYNVHDCTFKLKVSFHRFFVYPINDEVTVIV